MSLVKPLKFVSKVNSKVFSAIQTMQSNSTAQSSQASNYQPSVPISLYRELSSELQSTQAKLAAIQAQNEQLTAQNQVLIQEFTSIAKSTQKIQQSIAKSNIGQQAQTVSQRMHEVARASVAAPSLSAPSAQPAKLPEMLSEWANDSSAQPEFSSENGSGKNPDRNPDKTAIRFSTQEVARTGAAQLSAQSGKLSGWWLAVTIILIVFTSFGAGYLLMRPFISK